MGKSVRSFWVVSVALVLAVLVASLVAGGEASGQTAPAPTLAPAQEAEMYRMKEWLRHAKPSDFGTPQSSPSYTSPAEAAKRQRIFTTAARSRLNPGLGTHLVTKSGLAGLAAGIWIHNGIMLYNYSECGETDCPEPLEIDAQFFDAADGGAMVTRDREGRVTGTLVMTSYEWDYSDASKYGTFRIGYAVAGRPENGGINTRIVASRTCDGANMWFEYVSVTALRYKPSPYQSKLYTGPEQAPYNALCVQFEHGEIDGDGTNKRTILYEGPSGYDHTWENPIFEVGEIVPSPATPAPNPYPVSPAASSDLYDAITSDPETCPPGVATPAEVCPGWKPWLEEDWRVPLDPQVREGLLGPVVGTWTTPFGGECKAYEYGAQVCDNPGGTTFVWIVKDWTAWMQTSGGDKDELIDPANRPQDPPTTDPGDEDEYKAAPMDRDESSTIANHAINNSGHRVPGIEPWNDVGKLDDYVYNTVNGVEFGREFKRMPSGLEGPFYPTTGDSRAYWDDNRKVIIVRNPNDTSGGTVFKPDREPGMERDYLTENFPNSTPPGSQ